MSKVCGFCGEMKGVGNCKLCITVADSKRLKEFFRINKDFVNAQFIRTNKTVVGGRRQYKLLHIKAECLHGKTVLRRAHLFKKQQHCVCNVKARESRMKRRLKTVFAISTDVVEAEFLVNSKYRLSVRAKCIHGKIMEREWLTFKKRPYCICRTVEVRKKTLMSRYGVPNPMHYPPFLSKQRKTAFSKKEYVWPSGRSTLYQGYKHYLYDILLKTFAEEAIITDPQYIRSFTYTNDEGQSAQYYPDAQTGNVIYEVKSWFTYGIDKNIEAKVEAVVQAGMQMELWIFETKDIFFRRIDYVDGRKVFIHPRAIFSTATSST